MEFFEVELMMVNGIFVSNRLDNRELSILKKLYLTRKEIKFLDIYISKHSRKCGNTLISFKSSNTKSIKENIKRYLLKTDIKYREQYQLQIEIKKEKEANLKYNKKLESAFNELLSLSDADLEKLAS